MGEDAASETRVDVRCVACIGGFVTTRQLSLVATLRLGLLDCHGMGYMPADGIVVSTSEAIRTAGNRILMGCGSSQGRDAENERCESEPHCGNGDSTKERNVCKKRFNKVVSFVRSCRDMSEETNYLTVQVDD